MDKTKPAPADYEVVTAREIGGAFRAKGTIITLLPKQAKYYMPPLGTGLKPAAPKATAAKTPKATAPGDSLKD